MTLLIDMDDVLEQLVARWVDYLNEHYGTTVKASDVTDWDISLAFPTLTKNQVYSVEVDDTLWDGIKPMPGADEALRKLIADGHEIFIVTSTYYETLRKKMESVLFYYYPYISWDHVIITHHKQMIKGDVLIDDAPHNLIGGDYEKLLFTACHNKAFDVGSIGAVRVNNWDEAYCEVCRISKEKGFKSSL